MGWKVIYQEMTKLRRIRNISDGHLSLSLSDFSATGLLPQVNF